MKTIADYMNAAKARQSFTSDLQLNSALGFRGSNVSHWRVGRSLPNDQNMARLAELAGVDPCEALVTLKIARCVARGDDETALAWRRVLEITTNGADHDD